MTVIKSLPVCFTDALPLDDVNDNFIRTVKRCVFSKCQPTPLKEPLTLAAVSQVNKHLQKTRTSVKTGCCNIVVIPVSLTEKREQYNDVPSKIPIKILVTSTHSLLMFLFRF